MKNKIGIAVITCDREDFFRQCIESIPTIDTIVVINDGSSYPSSAYPTKVKEVIQHSKNKCVGISKNEALRYLIQDGCEHIFLSEDDITIRNPNVCEKYIRTAEASGIWHLNFGGHGNHNKNPNTGELTVRNTIDYGGTKVDFYYNILGAWSYYHRGVIKHIGYMDERYINAMEHVDHTYNIIKAGLHSPYWYFADAHQSYNDIVDIMADHAGSKIRKNQKEWIKNFQNACAWFNHKHGFYPTTIPDKSPQEVLQALETIKNNYARKVL